MNIYDFNDYISTSISELNSYKNQVGSVSDIAVKDICSLNGLSDVSNNLVEAIQGPSENWVSLLNEAISHCECGDITDSRTCMCLAQNDISNAINNVNLQLSCIHDIILDIESISDQENQYEQSLEGNDCTNTFKVALSNSMDLAIKFQDFVGILLSNLNEMSEDLCVGVNPYNYDEYNSPEIITLQSSASLDSISTLRDDFFG